jgi:D-glycero-alpha-D-manno-heptose-7-phosphate kinase
MMSGMGGAEPTQRIVNAVAPIRICDNGGWTDTWFAGHGEVFNIAVTPGVEVQIVTHPPGALSHRVVLCAERYGERYGFDPGMLPGRLPLLEAAVDEIGLPEGVSAEITVSSHAPAGSSTGTSASTTVALIGALDALGPRLRSTPYEVASAAHRIEVDRLGVQSGVQDQLCAAFGGICFIEVSSYPQASVSQLRVPDRVWWELEGRLALVYLGRSHASSDVHDRVVAGLAGGREDADLCLEELRSAARDSRDAVMAADVGALGQAMRRNTEAQRRLHPDLVSPEAQRVIDVAAAHDALGWKVNGAGGSGGSLTLLCGAERRARRDLLRAVQAADPLFEIVPTSLSRTGLRVWDS